ncbi:hypothetical protein D3C85_931290 [compost metagenome]
MGDAAVREDLARVLEDDVLRAAHVGEHGQVEVAGDSQLLAQKMLLLGAHGRFAQHGDEEIEADLADGDEARVIHGQRHGLAQGDQIVFGGVRHVDRMDAQRIAGVGRRCRQVAHDGEIGPFDGGDDNHAHALLLLRARRHLQRFAAKFMRVEVAVRVDPQHGGSLVLLSIDKAAALRPSGAARGRSAWPVRYRA